MKKILFLLILLSAPLYAQRYKIINDPKSNIEDTKILTAEEFNLYKNSIENFKFSEEISYKESNEEYKLFTVYFRDSKNEYRLQKIQFPDRVIYVLDTYQIN